MDPAQFFAASRVVIVAGKGGVGKTTVSAALSRAAALSGLPTLLLELEGKSGLSSMFGTEPLSYTEVELAAGDPATGAAAVTGRTLTPDEALLEYLDDHGLHRLSKRLVSSGIVDVVATAAPGIKDILVLGKVKQLEQALGAGHLVVLDAPAAGHAIRFLQSARGLEDAVRVGPVNAQAKEVSELLADPTRCQVVLVTLPEETPVNELVETAFSLEDRVGISLGPVVVNGTYPHRDGLDTDPAKAAAEVGATLRPGEAEALAAAAAFRTHRIELQEAQLERLAGELPLPQLRLPFVFAHELGPDQIDELAHALLAGIAALDEAEVVT